MAERKKLIAKKSRIKSDGFPQVDLKHSHFANFHANLEEVIISFMQIVPPVTNNASFDAEIRCISRIVLSTDNFVEFVESVNSFFDKRLKEMSESDETTEE